MGITIEKLEGETIGHVQPSKEEVTVEYFIDPAEEKRVLWKIDRAVMPLMFVVFFFQCKLLRLLQAHVR